VVLPEGKKVRCVIVPAKNHVPKPEEKRGLGTQVSGGEKKK